MEDRKILLNVEETAAYLNIGKTKTREIMKENEKIFVVRIGNRNYAHKNPLLARRRFNVPVVRLLVYVFYLLY